jgi:hypothetical protein
VGSGSCIGRNSNHSYDIAPRGSRWPYTFITLVLEDSDFLYFKRISDGTGYADAVFMHTETSTPFYKATIAWNGNGWTLRLADGTEVRFPESYNAKIWRKARLLNAWMLRGTNCSSIEIGNEICGRS